MGPNSVANQLRCSLWRHYLGHVRQWAWVVGALVVAVTPFALLAGLKSTAPPQHQEACYFEARGLSTEWPLGLVQSFVCGMSNECQDAGKDDLLDSYPGAAVNELINASHLLDGTTASMLDRLIALPGSLNTLQDVADLITAPAATAFMEKGLSVKDMVRSPSELTLKLTSHHDLDPEVVKAFLDSKINITRVMSLSGIRSPREVVCSPQDLGEFLVTNNTELVSDISWALCHLPLSQAANVTAVFLASIDPQKLIYKVGEVMEVIGGYKSEVLVQQVGSLMAALGRLEALTPLGSSMAPILRVLSPAKNAMEILSSSMWDEVSLGDFFGFVEDVMQSLHNDSSAVLAGALSEATNAALHMLTLTNNTHDLADHLQDIGDPWEAVLTQVSVSTEALAAHIDNVPGYVKQHPILRTLLSLAATGLSTLLHSHPPNTTRLELKLDEVLNTLVEEYQIPLNTPFALTLLPDLHSATVFTEAVDAMASLVVKDPPLPFLPSFSLLMHLSNCSHLKRVIFEEGDGLASWACDGDLWDDLSLAERNALSDRLCSDDGRTELTRITQMLHKALNYSQQETQADAITVSEVLESLDKLMKTMDSATHIHQALELAEGIITTSVDEEWWWRWQPETDGMMGHRKDNYSESLLPLLPALGSEGFQDLKEGVKGSKYIIYKLVTIYLNLMTGVCGGVPGPLRAFIPSGGLENTADLITSVLDTLVHLAAVTQDPWRPDDLLRHPNVTSFLTTILPPNMMVAVTRALEVAQYPVMEVPAPIPQVLALLNATHTALTAVLETGDVWAWCGGGSCPHLANLTSRVHLLPHLLALPYFTTIINPEKEVLQILTNSSAWRYYPCQNTTTTPASLTLLFPATTSFTLESQATIMRVKQGVRDLEEYICGNFDAIVDELTSNEGLTTAVKGFMERLTTERVNLGAAVGLLRSLWRTVTQLDIQDMAAKFTGGALTLQDWERPYSYLAYDASDPKSVLMKMMEGVLERVWSVAKGEGTSRFYHTLNLGLHAAHNITTAITHTLEKGEVTLAEMVGVSEDDPLFSSFLLPGPQGLSDYLLRELNTTFINFLMERDVNSWVNEFCNHSSSSSNSSNPWVDLACNYTLGRAAPAFLGSKVSVAVEEAMIQFQLFEAPRLSPMSPSQLLGDFQDLIEAFRQFDFTKPPNTTALDLMVNTTLREMNELVAGLWFLQDTWPYVAADAVVQKGPLWLQDVVRETDGVLSVLLQGIPSSSDNATSPIADLYHLLNATWMDLLAGIHYNLHQEVPLLNLTLEGVCGPNSTTLKDPQGADGTFMEAIEKLCLFVSTNADIFEEYMHTRNASLPPPSTKDIFLKALKLVRHVEEVLRIAKVKGPEGVLGWPTYFVKDNWRSLLTRIYPGTNESTTTEGLQALVPSMVVALHWLGVPLNSSSVPQNIELQIKWMNLMQAQNLKEALNGTSMLSGLADTFTHTLPNVVKEVVNTLNQHPQKMEEVLVALRRASNLTEVCQVNMSALGNSSTDLLNQLCQMSGEKLEGDLRSLLGLGLLQHPDPSMSLEEALTSLMAYISTLDNKATVGLPQGAGEGLVEYLGLQRWVDLPADAFNNTWEEAERNSTMMLASIFGPLLAQGEDPSEGSRIIRGLLLTLSGYLRLARWVTMVTAGNLREAYIDKPMVLHLLDILDQLPQITEEYITLFSNTSMVSALVTMKARSPCTLHNSLLEVAGAETEEGSEGRQLLNTTAQFLCDRFTTSDLLPQLSPSTLPVILGQTILPDGATLAHMVMDTGKIVADAVEGRHTTNTTFTTPPWLAQNRWMEVYQKLLHTFRRPVGKMLIDGAFITLSGVEAHYRAPWVDVNLPATAALVYHVSHRLADATDENSGNINLTAAVEGLGSLGDLVVFVVPRLPTFVSLALWYPESYANWKFINGVHVFDILDEMCEKGLRHLLLHPGLPRQDWEDIRQVFCNLSLPQLREDLNPLLNDTEIMKDEERVVDWSMVSDAVLKVVQLPVHNIHKLEVAFTDNAYTRMTNEFHPILRVVQGVLGQLVWLQRGSREGASRGSQVLAAHGMALILASVEPITKQGAPSVIQQLVDPQLFRQLVKDYQDAMEHLRETMKSHLQQSENQTDDGYPLYGQVYSDLHETVINITKTFMPRYRMHVGNIVPYAISNAVQNGGEIMKIVLKIYCGTYSLDQYLRHGWVRTDRWLGIVERQLERVEEHVDLLCLAPTTNLTQLFRSAWEDLGWKDEVTNVVMEEEDRRGVMGCSVLNQVITTYEKTLEVVNRYGEDEAASTRLFGCLGAAVRSSSGQQFIGLMTAAEDFLRSVSNSPNLTRDFSASIKSLPLISWPLRMLASRVAVMVPLQEVLVAEYGQNMNLTGHVLNATKRLMVDVNRLYPGYVGEVAMVSKSLERMQRWMRVMAGDAGAGGITGEAQEEEEEEESPVEVLFKFAESRGAELFAEDLLREVNYAYLLTKVDMMRMKAVLSLTWLDPIISHMTLATESFKTLSQSGSIMDLTKVLDGQVDPFAFISGSLQFIQMREWNYLAQSFQGVMNDVMPLLTGSQLEEDLLSVVDGISSVLAARDMGLMDFKVPITSLVVNWTDLENYLVQDLKMDTKVVETLASSQLNLLALLHPEGTSVEELLCMDAKLGRLVVLPSDTRVTPAQLSAALCSTNDTHALAASFLSHINLTPLMNLVTQFGVNTSLSSHGVSLGEVAVAVRNVVEASEHMPAIITSLQTINKLSDIMLTPQPRADRLVTNETSTVTIRNITSPEFLERAGQALCGRRLTMMPDTLRLQKVKQKASTTHKGMGVCERLHEDLRSLPGGGLLLHHIQPLLKGKIFFTPDNSITRAIIAEANKTFEAVAQQQENLRRLSQQAQGITSLTATDFDLQRLEKAFELPWVQGAMKEMFQSMPSSFNLSSLPPISSLTANLKQASPHLLQSSRLVREFSDVLEVGVSLMSCLHLQRFIPAHNETHLLEEAHRAVDKREFLAGVVFKDVGESGSTDTLLPPHLTYTIRVDYTKSPPTFLLGPKFWRPGPYSDMAFYMRYHQGFIQLQEALENAIVKLQHQQNKAAGRSEGRRRRKRSPASPLPLTEDEEDLLLNLPLHTKQQPYPCYTKDDFLQMVNESPVMSFIFSFLALVLFSTFIIKQLVQERESRNKQLQEVMGLRVWLDHLVWLLYSLLLLLVIVVLAAAILSLGGLQPRANFGVLIAFLLCYGLSVVSFCYLVACLVPTTVLAVFTGVMSLLVFNIPFISISVIQASVPLSAMLLTCLFPSSAFGFGFRIICQYELVEKGANYDNMWIPPTKGSDMSLGLAVTMLLLDTLLFLVISLITTHLRNVHRGAGFLDVLPDTRVAPGKEDVSSIKKEAIHSVDLDLGFKQSLRKGLSIKGLRKIYRQGDGGSRLAVDGVTLDLYEGQVLALLGHNGAGKTTIISMLTREVKPTAGKILVYGQDINTNKGWEKARQMIGLCPQESVLFPLLTVEETLAYYTILKQHSSDPPPTKVATMLANMNLLEHRFFMAHQLSEGLRRRLCMALAFVGHSKLVVLDEPTSGIDPAARSVMWEVISNNRSGRTILLTTHHLDEAETLADRVAVLHKGRLLCVGSPLALKSEYGLGYSITLSKVSPHSKASSPHPKEDPLQPFKEKTAVSYCEIPFKVLKTQTSDISVKEGTGDKDKVWDLLTSYVPNARLLESINGEVTYSLPIHDSVGNTNRLPELFGELENNLHVLGYVSMELRPTSLEDVIIALNTINALETTSDKTSIRVESSPTTAEKEVLSTSYNFALDHGECFVWLRRLAALLHKRLLHHGRDWHFYVQMFVLPFVFILLAMVASKFRPSFSKATPLTLDPSLYPPPATTFLRTLDPALGPLGEEVTRLTLGSESRTWNESFCPDNVADTNPGIEQCSIAGSSVRSGCQCYGERCVVEVTEQPSLNDWILATRSEHVQTRHGGITLGVRDPREGSEGRSGTLIWYDNAAYHALPSYINLVNNARLRRLAGPGHTITAINHPIVFSLHGIWSMSIEQYVADLGIGLLVLVALTVVCSATVGCMVAERVRGERRLMHLAGLSKTTYWIGSALWDTGVVVLNILLISVIFVVFKEQQFIWRENLGAFVLLALLYGLSILPLYYLLEGWFRTEASAVFFFFCSFFGVGLITTLLLVVCQVMSYIKGMNDTAAVIKYLFLVFPPFAFTCSLKDMASSYTRASIMARFDMDLYESPFTWDPELDGGLGVYMVALSVWVVVGWTLLLCPRPSLRTAPLLLPAGEAEEDKDVAAERIKIQCGGASLYDTVLRLVGLGKDFTNPAITAVNNLFLAIHRGECFSLLGLNGAGKTTTFRCLTGDLQPSRGQILVNGLLLEEALDLTQPILSYCPQSHALDPNLTPREILINMARIRGACGPRTKKVVKQAIKQLGLSGEANTYVRHLSGGNKRKLSVAVSLLGNPLLVLMDEPTTGMDPSSRRLVWRAIQSVSQDGRSVLLTSHSMDEVNQLSHRMAIMVNGHFVCLGSPHYLKDRLGDKYTVRIKTSDIEDMSYVLDYLRSHLKEVLLKEHHHLSLTAEVSRQLPLQLIFDTLNGAKSLGVTEYDVSQTTLNEVFRVLTSHQSDGYSPPYERLPTATHTHDLLPSLIPHLYSSKTKTKDLTLERASILAPVECDNPEDPYGNYAVMLGKYGIDGPLVSKKGSASPEEEWTHL